MRFPANSVGAAAAAPTRLGLVGLPAFAGGGALTAGFAGTDAREMALVGAEGFFGFAGFLLVVIATLG